MKNSLSDPAIYLAGPTASGKTGVAVALAHKLGNAEIVNADAFQIYRGLEILTAVPTDAERAGIPHRLFGELALSEECDAASFATRARKAIDEIAARGALPIVTGGSGLYLKALTHGLADTPPGDPELRAELDKLPLEELVARLELADPEGAAATNLKNRRYVTRNLEISILTGRPASEVKQEFAKNDPQIRAVFLNREREALYERINRRTELMFEEGVVDQVLRIKGQEISVTAAKAIGLRDIQALIRGEIAEPECIAAIQQATRRFSKRQSTWFRREKAFQTVCVAADDTAESVADRILERFPDLKTCSEMAETINIPLTLGGDRAYEIVVGDGLLDSLPAMLEQSGAFRKRAALVTDSTVGPLYGDSVAAILRAAGYEIVEITVPAGEVSKSMEMVTEICRKMLQAGLDRKSFLIALGGGVVGDLAGFAGAIFQRGIPCVQIPTTVLAQVDSSVGGKTGVNAPEGKNLIGAFHQPRLVVADVAVLKSLSDRAYNEGFAEIIKHAAIRDAGLLDLVEQQGTSREQLAPLIARNVRIKAAVVEEDERETAGVRALLNFGHTIGHGIENAAGYGQMLHGEAISLGLVAASRLSVSHSTLAESDCNRIVEVLNSFGLPTVLPEGMEKDAIVEALKRDKKFDEGQVRFVLLRSLGDAFVSEEISMADLSDAIDGLTSTA